MMTAANDIGDPSLRKICLGKVTGPQGLDGSVRIKSYTAHPEDIASYGPVTDKEGRSQFDIQILRSTNKGLVAKLGGIEDRAAAEAIKGLELYVTRDVLPEPEEGEFYFSDLIGLDVVSIEGNLIGKVKSMDNFGAGNLIEIEFGEMNSFILPFSDQAVPVIDIVGGRVVVRLPDEDEPDHIVDALEIK